MKNNVLFGENGLFSGKRVLALVIAATFFSGTALGAAASSYTFGSTGDVVYDQGGTKKVVFDNDDLKYLGEKIDAALVATDSAKVAAETGKKEIAKKLNTWSIPTKLSEENPTYDGIKTSLDYIKSTPGIGTAYKDEALNQYYVKPDGGRTIKASEADTSKAEQGALKIAAATADNLSAGTAAWVNGSFIIGTGSDNNKYYDDGKEDGNTVHSETKTITSNTTTDLGADHCIRYIKTNIPSPSHSVVVQVQAGKYGSSNQYTYHNLTITIDGVTKINQVDIDQKPNTWSYTIR